MLRVSKTLLAVAALALTAIGSYAFASGGYDPVVEVMSGPGYEQMAVAIGVSPGEVMAALQQGRLRELVRGQGLNCDLLTERLIGEMQAELAMAYREGKLTRDRYQEMERYLATKIRPNIQKMLGIMANFPGGDMSGLEKQLENCIRERATEMERMGLISDREAAQICLRAGELMGKAMKPSGSSENGGPAMGGPANGGQSQKR